MQTIQKIAEKFPQIIVFDLDACCWYPEMYQIWGGGSPFTYNKQSGHCIDKRGKQVKLLGIVRNFFKELHTNKEWADTKVAVASCCDEPEWARECLKLFIVYDNVSMFDIIDYMEIYSLNKQNHLKSIQKQSGGIPFNQMIFFDDQMGNIESVKQLGVICINTPDGVTQNSLDEGLKLYRQQFEKL